MNKEYKKSVILHNLKYLTITKYETYELYEQVKAYMKENEFHSIMKELWDEGRIFLRRYESYAPCCYKNMIAVQYHEYLETNEN